MPPRIPSGRAGRIWLRRRLGVAARGRDHLDRKLRILTEDARLARTTADRARATWADAYALARTWELRAALIEGPDAARRAADRQPTVVRIAWISTLGVTVPSDVQVLPGAAGASFLPHGAAAGPAVDAAIAALTAGVELAVADRAVQALEEEVAATRRRLRALDRRWLPWLTGALAGLELALEQAEQEEGARLRRAVGDR